jgi:hypothetical protein
MSFLRFQAAVCLGMGLQAAISSALYPNGIDPAQQLRAAILFMLWSVLFTVVATVLHYSKERSK